MLAPISFPRRDESIGFLSYFAFQLMIYSYVELNNPPPITPLKYLSPIRNIEGGRMGMKQGNMETSFKINPALSAALLF